jgi:predicted  nucleic acid-binding Zn-ribbon protein
MNELNEIRQRILTALSVVEAGIGRLSAEPVAAPAPEPFAAPDSEQPDPAALAAELAEERTLTAQLEERIRTLKDRQDQRLAALDGQIMAQRDQLAALDGELQALRQTNAELRDVAAQMREALSEGVAEPELVNRAMMAEIEALRATRAADRAEVEAVLGALEPLIREQG